MEELEAVSEASERTVAALITLVSEQTTENKRRAATSLVALRGLFEHQGRPDWTGRSAEYRDHIRRLYRQAGVPSDSEGGVQANLRYHLGNVLRQVAPPDDLAALGLLDHGPRRRRVHDNKVSRPPRRAGIRKRSGTIVAGDPSAAANLALDALLLLGSLAPGPDVRPTLRRIVSEAVELLSPPSQEAALR